MDVKLNQSELKEYLGLGKNHIIELVKKDAIPVVRIGERTYFSKQAIDRWLLNEIEGSSVNED